ncbi:MAG: hypothetical protein KDM64_05810, partial [Verrucomicrobiae bacterium]|nr:hypothetical protein [Verrucomicrobiae bacterium]
GWKHLQTLDGVSRGGLAPGWIRTQEKNCLMNLTPTVFSKKFQVSSLDQFIGLVELELEAVQGSSSVTIVVVSKNKPKVFCVLSEKGLFGEANFTAWGAVLVSEIALESRRRGISPQLCLFCPR